MPSSNLAVLPHARGPSFPGARADSPLSCAATSPLQHVSRHRFAFCVFQQVAFPRRRALTDVRNSLGPRARFRALCLTPRFFGPRCRQTNSAILTFSTHGHAHRTDVLARIDVCRHVSAQHRSPEGAVASHGIPRGVAPRTLARTEPELQRPNPERPGDEFAWAGRPERRTYRSRFPSSSTSRTPGSPSRFDAGDWTPTSCTGIAEDPLRIIPREGNDCLKDRGVFHCFGILA